MFLSCFESIFCYLLPKSFELIHLCTIFKIRYLYSYTDKKKFIAVLVYLIICKAENFFIYLLVIFIPSLWIASYSVLIFKNYVFTCFFLQEKEDKTSSHTHWNIFHIGYLFLNFEYSVLGYPEVLSFYVFKSVTLSFRFCFYSYS